MKNSIISERKGLHEQYRDQQEAKQLQNRISSFMKGFKVGTLLHGNGIRKLRGVSPLTLFTTIFSLPFEGAHFSREIVRNPNLGFKKDAAKRLQGITKELDQTVVW